MGKPLTSQEKIQDIQTLRKNGMSIKEISRLTRSSVATVSKYISSVEISKDGQKRLLERRNYSKTKSRHEWEKTHFLASKIVHKLNDRDKILIAISLYWGEGTKKELNLINGDHHMIKTFLEGILILGVKKEDVKISIRYYSHQNKKNITKFWLSFLNLNQSNLSGYEKVASNGTNKLEYGMCRLRVLKGSYYHKVIMNAIKIIKSPGSSMDRTEAS